MSLGSGLKNYNGGNAVSDSGSQDAQRSKTKPGGGAVSVGTGWGSCKKRLPERFLLLTLGPEHRRACQSAWQDAQEIEN